MRRSIGFVARLWCLGLLAPSLAGCDAQVDTDYQGDAIARVVGTIFNEMSSPPSDAVVALVWANSATSPDLLVGESVPASARFPADFSMNLYAPPPQPVLNDFTYDGAGVYPDERRIGLAWVAVGAADAAGKLSIDDDSPQGLFGLAENQVLSYVEDDVVPGTFCASLLGGALEAGFHVLEVRRQSEAEIEKIYQCKAAASTRQEKIDCGIDRSQLFSPAADEKIRVRLVDDPSQLEGPDLK